MKKNPYKFTIGFDESNPVHVRAAQILNEKSKGMAQLIADAVVSYKGESAVEMNRIDGVAMDIEVLEPLLKELIQRELGKVQQLAVQPEKRVEEVVQEVVQVIDEDEVPLDEAIVQNVSAAMHTFRK